MAAHAQKVIKDIAERTEVAISRYEVVGQEEKMFRQFMDCRGDLNGHMRDLGKANGARIEVIGGLDKWYSMFEGLDTDEARYDALQVGIGALPPYSDRLIARMTAFPCILYQHLPCRCG